MAGLNLGELEAELERLASGFYFAEPLGIALQSSVLLTPPEQISTTNCAATYRYLRNAEGGERLWDPALTPYVCGIQDALDNPKVAMVAVSGPARSGKTTAFENHLFKRLKFGPLTDTIFYMPPAALDEYLDNTVAPLFELHPDISSKIGTGRSDNKRDFKKVAGKFINWLPAQPGKIVAKQAPLIGADETDIMTKKLRSNIVQQITMRQRAFGSLGKGYVASHCDAGWNDGIASIWLESNRGEWWWPCPDCKHWSSPCPKAEHRMVLNIDMPKHLSGDELMQHVAKNAGLVCPHCGSLIDNAEKKAMNAAGIWLFDGQEIDVATGKVTGEPRQSEVWGFWIHGTMSPFVTWQKLAQEVAAAIAFYRRTLKRDRLKEVTAKALGEVDQGDAGGAQDFGALKKRAEGAGDEADQDVLLGYVPRWARFLTAAVDVGGAKFDVIVIAWGADGESKIVDRFTLVDIDGRKLSPGQRQADWLVLREKVMRREYPLAGRPGWFLPIASTGIDAAGVPGVTHKAREFARQMKLAGGPCYGANAYKLRLFQGSSKATAPEIGRGREINVDDKGKPLVPAVTEYTLGVHKLKELTVARLGVEAPGPGYVHLPRDMEHGHIQELTAEVLVDGKWERHGANETFDLKGYAEAVRQLLQPDRPNINWRQPPVWARPVCRNQNQSQGASRPELPKEAGWKRLAKRNAAASVA